MAKSLFLAWASPVDLAAEVAFNLWYDEVHVPEVRAAVPSIVRVERYRLDDVLAQGSPESALPRYLAIYEMDGDDLAGASAQLRAGIRDGRIVLSELLNRSTAPPLLQWHRHV